MRNYSFSNGLSHGVVLRRHHCPRIFSAAEPGLGVLLCVLSLGPLVAEHGLLDREDQ